MTKQHAIRRSFTLAALLLIAACGSDDDDQAGTTVATAAAASSAAASSTATVAVETSAAPDTEAPDTTAAAGDDPYDYGGSDTTVAATEAPASSESMTSEATIGLATIDELGDVIVDSGGYSLYLFVPDGTGPSTCNEGCATAWPPTLVEGEPVAGEGLDPALLGTTTRTDGTTQVTYAGHPLYRFSGDIVPGDANGQESGDVWYLVDAAGNAIETD